MKTCKRRILAIMLALLIAFAGLPAGAFTASAVETTGEFDGVTWRVDTETKTMYLHTDGALDGSFMYLMDDDAFDAWVDLAAETEHLVLEEGITRVDIFLGYLSGETLTLPNSLESADPEIFDHYRQVILRADNPHFKVDGEGVLYSADGKTLISSMNRDTFEEWSYTVAPGTETIGDSAFEWCYDLKQIVLPDSLLHIGNSAFLGCNNLESVTFGNHLQTIGSRAFYCGSNLQSVQIPASVTEIGDMAFYSMYGLERITVSEDNTAFSDADGVLMNKDKTVLIQFPGNYPQTDYTVPEGVKTIGQKAFSGSHHLQKLTLPQSLDVIEDYGIGSCSRLCEIVFPDSMVSIGKTAFYSEPALRELILPDGITTIESYTIYDLKSLERVHIPQSVTEIAENQFVQTPACTICAESAGGIAEEFALAHGCTFEVCDGHGRPAAAERQQARQALEDAIDGLLDPQQLYYYTDEAILWVASALGYENVTADAFIALSRADGYQYVGAETADAMNAAAAALTHLMEAGGDETTLNARRITGDVIEFPNRDESKAHVTLRTVPVAVNGEAVDGTAPLELHAGDRVDFAFSVDTDFYVSTMLLPILYDSERFIPVDNGGTAHDPKEKIPSDDLIEITASPLIDSNYDTELLSADSFPRQYPPEFRTESFMARYKILAIDSMCQSTLTSKVIRFDSARDGALLHFTMQAAEDMIYGADNACVGCPAEWYPLAEDHSDLFFSVSRAAGYLDDGVTPASSFDSDWNLSKDRSNPATAHRRADVYASLGQTCVCEPTIPFCQHTWDDGVVVTEPTCTEKGEILYTCTTCGETKSAYTDALGHEWNEGMFSLEPTCVDEGEIVYTCTRCGEKKYEAVEPDPDAHYWGAWENDGDNHIRYCEYDPAHFETADHDFVLDAELSYPPNCTEEGQNVYCCTVCNAQKIETVSPNGHLWDEGEIVKVPTCVEEGEIAYTCTRCGGTYTDVIAIDPDAHVWDAGVAAGDGKIIYTCTRCGVKDVRTAEGLLALEAVGRAVRGKTFKLTVQMQQNPGVAAMQFALDYDANELELLEVRNESVFADDEMEVGPFDTVPVSVQWISSSMYGSNAANVTATGALVTFTFRVRADAPIRKTQITLTYDEDNVFDSDWQNVLFTVQNTALYVIAPRGNVNGEGGIDLKDVTILRRYLVGWDYTIDTEQADVNFDGKVNLKDVAELMRILAGGWDAA